ncbi:integrase [Mycobacteroides abscessus subsp. bolletii]|uniref:tyrosine-type recombinase/integrase n=1 Tax=Mycobacteroides abscessus TaxID=36809 RepID=UPI0009A5FBE1|nr:tyrosine-type recombinase/integrase [Mycobacteroides abscessus]SKG79004.1 integrase [Mycobacteroides abscessus subsp. bolletii]SKH05649.1 integrase [Mycobacteroides abscessus subsp. bolletii]
MADSREKNKRRDKGLGGLYVDAKGYHVAYVYVTDENGKRRQIRRAAKTERLAKEKLRDLLVAQTKGELNPRSSDRYTVAEWLRKWTDEIHKDRVKPESLRDYRSTIRNYITPYIGTHRLDKLTADHVRKMVRSNQKEHSPRSAQKAYVVLNRAVADAVKEEVVPKNVVALVHKPGYTARERGAYDQLTAKKMLAVAAELDERRSFGPYLASRWAFAFLTGARQAECLGMEWDRVYLDEGVLDVSWQLQNHTKVHGCGGTCDMGGPAWCPQAKWDFPAGYEYRECHRSLVWTRPKSVTSERFVPMTEALVEILKVYKQEQAGRHNPHNLLWHHDDGRPVSQRDDNRAWNELVAACGITKKRGEVLLHEARNTAATQLMEDGVDARAIQEFLGHAHILTTRHYQKVDMGFLRKSVAGLDALVP